MTKRKPVDEVRWAWVTLAGELRWPAFPGRAYAYENKLASRVIRVRVTEVVKKKRSKKR